MDTSPSNSRALTLAAMSLGFGIVQLDVTIVNVALDAMGHALGGAVDSLQWVVNAYTIAFAAFILTAGALGDRIGAKRVFIAGFALFTTASLACALAPGIAVLIAARCVQGLAAAMLVPNSLALLNHAYDDEAGRAGAVALWAAGASVALTAGPLAGGALIASAGWRSIFLVNLPIGLVGLGLTWRYARETPAAASRTIDAAGQSLVIPALGALAGALIGGGRFGWSNAWVLGGFAVAALLLTLFVAVEHRSKAPMLPLSLFRARAFSVSASVGLLINVAFYGLIFVLSLYLQRADHMTPLQTGLAFSPMTGAVLPANLAAPRLTAKVGARAVIVTGAVMAGASCLALLGLRAGAPYASLCLPLIVMGAGLGLIVPAMTSTLLGSADKSHSGVASGVLNAMRQTGSVLGVALFGSFIAGSSTVVPGLKLTLGLSVALFATAAAAAFVGLRSNR